MKNIKKKNQTNHQLADFQKNATMQIFRPQNHSYVHIEEVLTAIAV